MAALTDVAVTADPHDGRSVRVTPTEYMTPLTGPLSTDEQTRLTALLTKALGLENP